MNTQKITVLYHANCMDGFGAAFAAWLKLGDSASYIPAQYNEPIAIIEPCDRLYILDFSYSADTLRELVASGMAKQVVVLDHHKTAEADLRDLPSVKDLVDSPDKPGVFVHFDMEESGATLTWRFLNITMHPTDWFIHSGIIPDFFLYLRDRDLWKWELDRSREFSAGMSSYPQEFNVWELLRSNVGVVRLKNEGEAILRAQKQRVKKLCQEVMQVTIAGHYVPCVNATSDSSEVGEYLCELFPDASFSVSFAVLESGKTRWSLRSRRGFDVGEIAKQYGGGGHQAAAGFTTNALIPTLKGIKP